MDFWSRQEHATEGALLILRNPLKMSASPPEITRLPPVLGEHGAEILREVAYDDETTARLLAFGGVCAANP